jgi:hypothetical protein
VAIDQPPISSPLESSALPAIENEFPTYRAISSTAVLSLICGVASVFCYADLWFLLLVAASVLLGLYSIKKIRKFPDVLTGAGLARVGIGIGLLFGLTAVTRLVAEDITVKLDAGQFAKFYMGVIKDEPVSVALWFQQSPAYRKEKSPDDLVDELKKTKNPSAPNPYDENSQPILKIQERIAGGKGELHYSQIESKYVDGLTLYANALLEVHGPATKDSPEEEYALVQMMKASDGGRRDWVVKAVMFPYTPKSMVAAAERKHDDDGHGH